MFHLLPVRQAIACFQEDQVVEMNSLTSWVCYLFRDSFFCIDLQVPFGLRYYLQASFLILYRTTPQLMLPQITFKKSNNSLRTAMTNIPIIARTFIKRDEQLQTCCICFDVSEEMLQCNGACQSYYCTTCVSQRKMVRCPYERSTCSKYSPLRLVKIKNIRYNCPFNHKYCKQELKSVEQFWNHCEKCQFITKQGKEELTNKREYRCKDSHSLIFVNEQNYYKIYQSGGYYNTTNSERCTHCLERFLSKSVCLQCGIGNKKGVYCINCRPIPCQKNICAVGHQLEECRNFGDSNICDFCGLPSIVCGKVIYSDRQCNFDICRKCYERVPEKHHLVPLDNEITLLQQNMFI